VLRPALVALAVSAAPAAPACGPARLAAAGLAALGQPSLRLVEPAEGARLARADVLLQARGEAEARRLPGALTVRDGEPLAEPPSGRRFVVVSHEPDLALRLAARLAREGAAEVAVVAGGLPAWGPALARSEPREE
jgi:hypothetical protein